MLTRTHLHDRQPETTASWDGRPRTSAATERVPRYRLRARAIVNAAGPWVEDIIGRVARLNSRRAGAARERQPHRGAEVLGRPPGLPVQNHDKRRHLRQSHTKTISA